MARWTPARASSSSARWRRTRRSARLPFSPPVEDFGSSGYPLEGARLDYVGGQPVAVLVYKRREHVIDVFVRPGIGENAAPTQARDGFNIERFTRQGMRYWVVS